MRESGWARMTAMVSVALAVLITAGLALAVSHHLDARIGEMSSLPSLNVSGLGLEAIGGSHAVLHGMVGNGGTEAVRLASLTLASPEQGTCAPKGCALSASLRHADGSACAIGQDDMPCTLLPGESIRLGPSVHALSVTPSARYAISVFAEPLSGGSIVMTVGVLAR